MTKEELLLLLGWIRERAIPRSFDIGEASYRSLMTTTAAELERLHRLPGGLLAEAPAIPYARQAEVVERLTMAPMARIAAVAFEARHELSAAVATLRALAQEGK